MRGPVCCQGRNAARAAAVPVGSAKEWWVRSVQRVQTCKERSVLTPAATIARLVRVAGSFTDTAQSARLYSKVSDYLLGRFRQRLKAHAGTRTRTNGSMAERTQHVTKATGFWTF